MATPAGLFVQSSCAEIIEASARFERRPSRPGPGADVVPFIAQELRGLRPFLEPLRLTAREFLDDVLIRGRLPALREYLTLLASGQPPAPQDFLRISVDLDQVNELFSRGTLRSKQRMQRVDPAVVLRPGDSEIVLVFRGRVRQLQRDTRLLPIWDLVAVVTGPERHAEVERALRLRSGFAPAGLLKSNGWVTGEPVQIHDIPMILDLEPNPLEIFALMRVPTREEAFRTDFLGALRRGLNDSYEFWLPYAHSEFDVALANGDAFRGTLIGVFPEAHELTFLADGEYETVAVDMLDRIVLRTYEPARPDGRKIVIDGDLDHVHDVIEQYLDDQYLGLKPRRPFILGSGGLNLNP